MNEKCFRYAKPKNRCGGNLSTHWDFTRPAYRVAPHVWNVGGQDDVAVYLMDTGDGLAIFDTGYEATVYLVVDRIWSLGYRPSDIRWIFLTHYHGDHSQGARLLQEMTNKKAEIWLSREDELNHQRTKDDTKPFPILPYEVTNFYDDNAPIQIGRFRITTRLTPGHTIGATSFFFEDTDEETGKTYLCAIHGGLGVNAMNPSSPTMARECVTEDISHRFIKDCMELAQMPVELNLASHLNQSNVVDHFPPDVNDYTWFANDYSWHDMLVNRAEEVMSFYPSVYPDLVRTIPTIY